jgi:hypothetical protein
MMGAKKSEKEDRTRINVGARLISCHGCTTQYATKVMIAPQRRLMYLGERPARSTPPATTLPQMFWNMDARAKPRARKNTPHRDPDDPLPLSIITLSRSGAINGY